MKNFKPWGVILALLLFTELGWAVERRNIKPNQLPPEAQQYLKSSLGAYSIRTVTLLVDGFRNNYEVLLADGTLVKFNRDGGWKSVVSPNALPEEAFPSEIWDFLKEHHKRKPVYSIVREPQGYTLTMDGDKQLKFDNHGNQVK